MPLTANLFEHLNHQRLNEWRREGLPEQDIRLAAEAGMEARDVGVFRDMSLARIFVIRCPKPTAMPMHGLFPPKTKSIERKTGAFGLVGKRGEEDRDVFVSDYDMMSIWKRGAGGWQKIFASAANGASRGALPPEATLLYRQINMRLISRLQHGCQDDYQSEKNPGVAGGRFVAFVDSEGIYLPTPEKCAAFYAEHGLDWPYDTAGAYIGKTH